MQTIWLDPKDAATVWIIDQRALPHEVVHTPLRTPEDAATAIRDMLVRGAPLIGATASWGVYLAMRHCDGSLPLAAYWDSIYPLLYHTRPTAVDLGYALDRQYRALATASPAEWVATAQKEAEAFAAESAEQCYQIGVHGLPLIEAIAAQKKQGEAVNILTHCNAGKLACIDYGTATAPVYLAHEKGIPVHVWVDETRPRNQGAKLTAFELAQAGIPHTVIVDNLGGHLMQHGMVDIVFVGTDRTTRQGDVANKIGTYLKALAAFDNQIPFYVGLPTSTIDWEIRDGLTEIPIETRNATEVTTMDGWDGITVATVRITPTDSPAANYGFDVTPARLVTGLITERGVCTASEEGLLSLFPERKAQQ
ncbi:MAG: S-methyl-5-thioribose-1-phosphate isomerase [Saprospiraceae bacterium]